MIFFAKDEGRMLLHIAEVMGDRMDDTYEPEDEVTLDKVEAVGKAGSALVITGAEQSHMDAAQMFHVVVRSELDHWVPDASQRLIHRAGHALGVRHPVMLSDNPDCGAEPGWHALVADWIAGIYVRRCVTCCRIYADGTPE